MFIKTPDNVTDVVLVCLLLTLNIFHIFSNVSIATWNKLMLAGSLPKIIYFNYDSIETGVHRCFIKWLSLPSQHLPAQS